MKTQLIIIGLLATMAANGQSSFTTEMKWHYPTNVTLPYGLHKMYPDDNIPMPPTVTMPPALALTTTWETNLLFCGREIGFRSDGVVVWRMIPEISVTVTNGWVYSLTNANVESLAITNDMVKFYAITNYVDGHPKNPLEGVTNLVQLDEKIGHVWKYTNLKNRRCILCGKWQTEEWK